MHRHTCRSSVRGGCTRPQGFGQPATLRAYSHRAWAAGVAQREPPSRPIAVRRLAHHVLPSHLATSAGQYPSLLRVRPTWPFHSECSGRCSYSKAPPALRHETQTSCVLPHIVRCQTLPPECSRGKAHNSRRARWPERAATSRLGIALSSSYIDGHLSISLSPARNNPGSAEASEQECGSFASRSREVPPFGALLRTRGAQGGGI